MMRMLQIILLYQARSILPSKAIKHAHVSTHMPIHMHVYIYPKRRNKQKGGCRIYHKVTYHPLSLLFYFEKKSYFNKK